MGLFKSEAVVVSHERKYGGYIRMLGPRVLEPMSARMYGSGSTNTRMKLSDSGAVTNRPHLRGALMWVARAILKLEGLQRDGNQPHPTWL